MLQKTNMPPRSRRVLMFRQYCLSERLHDSQWIHSQVSNTQMLINILSAHSKRMQNTLQECKWQRDRDGQTDSEWFMVHRAAPGECVSSFPALLHSVRCQMYPIHPERQTQRLTSHLGASKWDYTDAVSDMIAHLFFCTLSFGGFLFWFSTWFPSGFVVLFIFLFLSSFPLFLPFRLGRGLQDKVWYPTYSSLYYNSCLKLYTLYNLCLMNVWVNV